MAFSLPADLATNWADNVGMIENAAYLNAVGAMNNSIKAALLGTVNGTATALVTTSETTTSTSYADLATTTDTVTVTIGASGMALVLLYAAIGNNTAGSISYVSFAVSGANTIAAADNSSLSFQIASGAGNAGACGSPFFLTGLATGSTTFKMKYRVSGTTGNFSNRRIAVIPFF